MTLVGFANQAALSTSLMGIMNAAKVGTVPVEIVGGCRIRFDVEGTPQKPLEPLVREEHTDIQVESIPGYWESGTDGIQATSVRLHRHWLEAGGFFRDWAGLQTEANWVAGLAKNSLATASLRTDSTFLLALLNEGMGNRVRALENYLEAANAYEERGEHTSSAMVLERALAVCGPAERERYENILRRRVAFSFYDSLENFETLYDPHRLRLARGLWYAHGCGKPDIYMGLIMKWAEYNEGRSAPVDAGSNELRMALAILRNDSIEPDAWNTASEMIRSAAALFGRASHFEINTETLLRLAAETAAFAGA